MKKNKKLQLIENILSRILIEGAVDNIINSNPELTDDKKQKLKKASQLGVEKNTLVWLSKYFLRNPNNVEPIEEIVATVKEFNSRGMKNKVKNAQDKRIPRIASGKSVIDINSYASIVDLRRVMSLTRGKVVDVDLKEESTTIKGDHIGPWVVSMPHTREAACTLGSETWCTAQTGKKNNLFYNYTVRKQANLILYHISYDPSLGPKDSDQYQRWINELSLRNIAKNTEAYKKLIEEIWNIDKNYQLF